MSDRKDQAADSHPPRDLPIKKRNFAYDQKQSLELNISALQKKAYHDVYQSFSAESSEISSTRLKILKELKEHCGISEETHTDFVVDIDADLQIKKIRNVFYEKKLEAMHGNAFVSVIKAFNAEDAKLKAEGSNSPSKNTKRSQLITKLRKELLKRTIEADWDDSYEKYIMLRCPVQGSWKEFMERFKDMHLLESVDKVSTWVDVRAIPSEHVMWERGAEPWWI